jgi:hypothetical protein
MTSTPGEVPAHRLEEATLESMQTALFEAGWAHSRSGALGVAEFSREYPRVNELLVGEEWREMIAVLPSVIRAKAPWVPRGLALGTSTSETEVGIAVMGDLDNKEVVTQAYVVDGRLRECGFEVVESQSVADWLVLKGAPGAPQPATAAFYEQSPRAFAIRAVCIPLIDNYIQVVADEGSGGETMAAVVELNRQLAELGIEPDMHKDARPVAFADPIKRAERVAGLLRATLRDGRGFSRSARAILQEHSMAEGADVYLDVNKNPTAASLAYLLMRLTGMLQQLGAVDL